MPKTARKSRARIQQTALLSPVTTPNTLEHRDEWLDTATNGFVSPSPSNKAIYRVILETLWPEGYGIPGPVVDREDIRKAVDDAKGKPYIDTFRRVRELQGEEGFLGVIKQGNRYQLINLNIYPKKKPRTHLSDDKWQRVVAHYNNRCAVCGCAPSEAGFQQDHKVPRARGGTDDLSNWQPVCDACNNLKSVSCRSCTEDCGKCSWALPEHYKPIKIPGSVVKMVHQYASEHKMDADQLVTDWILEKIK